MGWIAGTLKDVEKIDNWFVVDIGFSNSSKSCGVVTVENGEEPKGLTDEDGNIFYGALITKFQNFALGKSKIGLIIEAPLSVAFNNTPKKVKHGNPIGRMGVEQEEENNLENEKNEKSNRYWYVGAGATVSLATMNFLHQLKNLPHHEIDIHLFEGFVSFKSETSKEQKKSKKPKQPHWADARDLYYAIKSVQDSAEESKTLSILNDKQNADLIFIGNYLDISIEGNIPLVIKVSGVRRENPSYSFHEFQQKLD